MGNESICLSKIYRIISNEGDCHSIDKGWEQIWKFKGPTRLNQYLWFIRHDKLSIADLMFWRKYAESPLCFISGRATGTALHAIRDCSWFSGIWGWLIRENGMWEFFNAQSPQQWIDLNISSQGPSKAWNWRSYSGRLSTISATYTPKSFARKEYII